MFTTSTGTPPIRPLRTASLNTYLYFFSNTRMYPLLLYGEIESCTIKRKPDGSSKGYAFIVYKTEEGARAALQVREKEIDVFAISLCYSL